MEARPCVAHLVRLAAEVGIDLLSARSITRAREDCLTRLDPSKGHFLKILCNDAGEKVAERFKDILSGTGPAYASTPVATGRSEDSVLATPEESDPEIPRAMKPIKLQHNFSVLFGQDGHDHFTAHFVVQPNSECEFPVSRTCATRRSVRSGSGRWTPGHGLLWIRKP